MRLILVLVLAAAGCTRSSPPPEPAAAESPEPSPTLPSCAAAAGCAEACQKKERDTGLDACVARCGRGLRNDKLGAWAALQTCSKKACAGDCVTPGALGCRLCAMKNCASQIATCLSK